MLSDAELVVSPHSTHPWRGAPPTLGLSFLFDKHAGPSSVSGHGRGGPQVYPLALGL